MLSGKDKKAYAIMAYFLQIGHIAQDLRTGSSNYVSWTTLKSFVLVPTGYLLLALGFFCFNSGMV